MRSAAPTLTRREFIDSVSAAVSSLALAPAVHAATASQTVNVVLTQGVLGLTMHELARAQGYFEQLGVTPKVLLVSDGTKSVAALVSGAADIAVGSGFNQVIPAIERGAPLKIVAGALNLPSLAMYSAQPQITQVADLQGKTIGIGSPGSVLHQMTVLLLRKQRVDTDKVLFRNVGSNADILKAVAAKTVDAGLSDVDVFDEQQRFGIHALRDGLLWKAIPEYTNQATFAADAAIQSRRDALVRTLAAYAHAYQFASSPASKAAFIQARQTVTGATDPQQAVTQWTWIQQNQPFAQDLLLSQARLDLVQQLNVDFKVQQQVLPDARIADPSLARAALRLLT